MNYIGSKKTLLPFLEEVIIDKVGDIEGKTFIDLFAGTGAVTNHFKKLGCCVVANDFLNFCYVLNYNYIENNEPLEFTQLGKIGLSTQDMVLEYLDNLPLINTGFIYNNYSLGGTTGKEHERMYFTDTNAKKADTIKSKLFEWMNDNMLTISEYMFLMATLIENFDKVANTASVYAAYLKKFKSSAKKTFTMKNPAIFHNSEWYQTVYCGRAENIIELVQGDILYLDPPYNSRQYFSNYHILETLSLGADPIIKGKTGMPNYMDKKSNFSSKRKVKESFEKIISVAKVNHIFLSYNNEGLMSPNEIKSIMEKYGKYELHQKSYQRFKSDSKRSNKATHVTEYLHYLEVN